ncbi:MAG: tetratricopeptide repeat protein [Gemmatimonadetes bacterium]|nr:tetratricopeptide repeat protein [Gemmatimonadota bacterium]
MPEAIERLNRALEGRFEIEQEIGRGGMGIVYLARQLSPVSRSVALKVIEPGHGSAQALARFQAERQALAVMGHPSVAKIFEAGIADGGYSWFAMEHVPGLEIHRFCDEARLTIDERLRLYVQVCRGVQHAHQKGLIHRDLKPSNVLVTEVDGKPVPKIIDFGIAKSADPGLLGEERLTRADQIVGTPAYMSPEQIDGSADVDTRTDVYALGVMLYELLVGTLPYPSSAYRGWAALGASLTQPPPSLADRLRDLDAGREKIAEARRTAPSSLSRIMRGDLDYIVGRAMERDRDERYETPAELAADIERYRSSMPVRSSGASAAYLIRTFARRHLVGVAVSAGVLVLIVAFAAVMTVQAGVIARERDRAEQEATKAAAVNDFMAATLLAPDPIEGLGRDVTVVEALDDAVNQLDTAFVEAPELEAAARSAIGWALFQMGRYDDAEPLLERALEVRAQLGSPEEQAESILHWAQLQQVRGRFDSADVLFQRAIQEQRSTLGATHPEVAAALKLRGIMIGELGRYDEAEGALREALAIIEEHGDALGVADLRNQIGVILWNRGSLDEVEQLWMAALASRRQALGNDHPLVAEMLNNLAVFYDNTGRLEDAEPMYREALDVQRRLLGADHEEVAAAMANLAVLLDVKGEFEEAEGLYLEALRIDRGQFGDQHPVVGHDLVNLGSFLCVTGRTGQGVTLIGQAVDLYRDALEPGHWRIANALNWRGVCHREAGDTGGAESDWILALAIMSEALGEEHYRTQAIRTRLGDLYDSLGRPEDAARIRG